MIKQKNFPYPEAIDLKTKSNTKFPESIEAIFFLNIDKVKNKLKN